MATGRRTRILIVDDSAATRSLLRSVVGGDAGLEVAGSAANGEAALASIETLRPDVVLLDVEMPGMDGLATLRELRGRGQRMPVIMCSALTRRGASVTIEALASGASDYVSKPLNATSREAAIEAFTLELLPKVHALAEAGRGAVQAAGSQARPVQCVLPAARMGGVEPLLFARPSVLAIGVSTGGPAALDVLLPALPADFPLPVLVVQHMPEAFTRIFAERLNGRCRLRVSEASEGDEVTAGTIHVARGDWHMAVQAASTCGAPAVLHLNKGAMENHCRPAVDVLFRSAAAAYGAGVLAVVLTGMGIDGLAGCRILRERGGYVLAQDQASSAVWGMPGAVVNAGVAHRVLPLDQIAPAILRIAGRLSGESAQARDGAVARC